MYMSLSQNDHLPRGLLKSAGHIDHLSPTDDDWILLNLLSHNQPEQQTESVFVSLLLKKPVFL